MKKYGVSKVKTLQVARQKRPVQMPVYIKSMHLTVISQQMTLTLALPTVSVFFFCAALKGSRIQERRFACTKSNIARLAKICEYTFYLVPEVPARKSCGRNHQPTLLTL